MLIKSNNCDIMEEDMEPKIGRFPIEVFGRVYTDTSKATQEARKMQYCPYLCRECTKPRKSEPHIKVGICSVGYKGSFTDSYKPVIICPFRFLENVVFESIQNRFFPNWKNIKWIKEVNMGVSGNVDYVAVKIDDNTHEPVDFFCVEFQANGTTGSPYGYVKDLMSNGVYNHDYTFGLNWANEFMKTMMQQVYKKGNVINTWGRKIVFVIQDVAMAYLKSAVDTSDLRESMEDPIHFMTYKEVWDETTSTYKLEAAEWLSADLEGINKILAGANAQDYLTEDGFLNNAIKKGRADGII